jgi:hypothetical protein
MAIENKKNIWILSELFHPDETATAYIFTRIANHLCKKYYVNVICGPKFYDYERKNFSDNKKLSNEIKIYRFYNLGLNKNSLIKRFINHVLLSFWMCFVLIKNLKTNETVISATNPGLLILTLFFVKKIKNFKLHVLVHDVFPENTIPAKVFKSNRNVIFRIMKIIFDKSYASADHLIVLGRDMKKIMESKTKYYNKKLKISVVPNWSTFDQSKVNLSKPDLNKHNISILYAGNIGRVQGLFEVFNAFKSSENYNLIIKVFGSGSLKNSLKKYLKNNKISNISFNGSFSRNNEIQILNNCDVALVSLSKGMYGLGVPSKTYNILSSGKPILFIGNPESEISLLINEYNIGWSLDVSKRIEIINFFNKLNTMDKSIINKMGINSKKLANDKFKEIDVLNLFQSKIEETINY